MQSQVLKNYTHLMLTIRNVGRIPHTFKPVKPSYDSSTFPKSRGKKTRPPLKYMQQRNTMDGLNLTFSGRESKTERASTAPAPAPAQVSLTGECTEFISVFVFVFEGTESAGS